MRAISSCCVNLARLPRQLASAVVTALSGDEPNRLTPGRRLEIERTSLAPLGVATPRDFLGVQSRFNPRELKFLGMKFGGRVATREELEGFVRIGREHVERELAAGHGNFASAAQVAVDACLKLLQAMGDDRQPFYVPPFQLHHLEGDRDPGRPRRLPAEFLS